MTIVDTISISDQDYLSFDFIGGNRKRIDPWSNGIQHCKRRRLDPSEFYLGDFKEVDHYKNNTKYNHINDNLRQLCINSSSDGALVPSRKRPAFEPLDHWPPKHFVWTQNNDPALELTERRVPAPPLEMKYQLSRQLSPMEPVLSNCRAMVVWTPPPTSPSPWNSIDNLSPHIVSEESDCDADVDDEISANEKDLDDMMMDTSSD